MALKIEAVPSCDTIFFRVFRILLILTNEALEKNYFEETQKTILV